MSSDSDNTRLSRVEFHHDRAGVDWHALEQLIAKVNLGGRKGDKLRRAFMNNPVACYAYDADRLVGVARAVTDGGYHAIEYDVAIHPDYQGCGLGKKVMGKICSGSGVARDAGRFKRCPRFLLASRICSLPRRNGTAGRGPAT